jgi:hypothetical protein
MLLVTLLAVTASAKSGTDLMPAPVRAYMPELMKDMLASTLDPSPVFDMTVDPGGVPGRYAAMDLRQALKVLLKVRPRKKP